MVHMRKLILPLILFTAFIFSSKLSAQEIQFREVCKLPEKNVESSGLEINNRNELWSFNDSGGEPELYSFDTTGKLLRTVIIKNAKNVDWEEMTQDDKGNFYICDFGNNKNERKDLVIYKIPNPSNFFNDTIEAEPILFNYPDQKDFPPAKENMNFDMEACFYYQDSIYLFSKNRTEPYSGYLRVYTVPTNGGTYTARLVDSIYMGQGPYFADWITAADISPDKKTFILLSNNKFLLFKIKDGVPLTKSEYTTIFFPALSQKEGICYITPEELYLTDEVNKETGGWLYYLNVKNLLAP